MSRTVIAVCAAVVACLGSVVLPAMQLQTPTNWKWRTDSPTTVRNTDKDLADDQWFYVAMPPGWHITTKPGVVVYNPAHTGSGLFRLQSQAFLFPGDSQEEYGVFIGGRDLEPGSAMPSYTAFVARRDGRIAVLKRQGTTTTPLVDWTVNTAAVAHPGEGTAKNIFKVDVLAAEVVFSVNDTEVARLPKAQVTTDGLFGLRAGAHMNLHVSTFDATYVLAPVPVKVADTLRVVSYNIKHGRGNDNVVDLERTAGVLRALSPDIVGLQEVDNLATRSGGVPQAEHLGKLTGLHHAFGRFMDFQGGAYGMGILTRHPIVSTHSVQLPEGNEPRVALAAEVRLPSGRPLTIVNVHFDWVRDDGFRFAQAEALTTYLDALTMPYVLLGDFNDVPESRTLALFKSRAREAVKPSTDRFTFSSTEPTREIDFIFAAPAASWETRDVRVVDEPVVSDHRPVVAVLELR